MTSTGFSAGEQGIIGGRIDPERIFPYGVVELVKLLQCCHLSVPLLLTGEQIEGLLNDTNANGNHSLLCFFIVNEVIILKFV